MDRLPLEILQAIFTLACTDGGRTGCSLSLTSKSVRAAAHSTRFYSVFLDAFYEKRLRSFASTYQEQCQLEGVARPRVRHLYVTMAVHSMPSSARVLDLSADSIIAMPICCLPEGVYTLLQAVAGDVRSLVLQAFPAGGDNSAHHTPDTPSLYCTFPSLRELTTFGANDPCSLLAGPTADTCFPRLHRLHVVDTHTMYGRRTLRLDPWLAHAPQMTHLRVSNLSSSQYPFFKELAACFNVEDPIEGAQVGAGRSQDEACARPGHGTHLQHVILQPPIQPSVGAMGGRLYRTHCTLWKTWRVRAKRPAETGLNIVVVEPPEQPGIPAVWTDSMKREWMDRMCGGLGCWEDVEAGRKGVAEGEGRREDTDAGTLQ